MTPTTIQELNIKLKKLPEKVFEEVNEFLNFLYFKTEKQKKWDSLSDQQKQELKYIKNAFKQVNLLKKGKLKTRPAKDLLNEL